MRKKVFTHWSQIALPVLGGVILGFLLVALSQEAKPAKPLAQVSPQVAIVERKDCAQPRMFIALACAAEENVNLKGREFVAPKKAVVVPQPRPVVPKLPFYKKYVPVPKGQKPNDIRLHKSQVAPPHGAEKKDGQFVCGKKKDKAGKSDKNDRGHVDMQCCLDPDEIPNPYCVY